jgi:hypothetical protein
VRTARAEIRDALRDISGFGKRALRRLKPRYVGSQFFVGAIAQQALANTNGNIVRVERALDRE